MGRVEVVGSVSGVGIEWKKGEEQVVEEHEVWMRVEGVETRTVVWEGMYGDGEDEVEDEVVEDEEVVVEDGREMGEETRVEKVGGVEEVE